MNLWNKKTSIALCALAFSLNVMPAQARKDKDLENLRKDVIEQTLSQSVDEAEIKRIVETIREDGTWPGIDYTNVKREAFQHKIHLANLVKLSVAYDKKGCAWKGNRKVKEAFRKGVAYWVKHDFKCENWWNNEIGTPMSFISMLLAMDDNLTDEQIKGMLPIAQRACMDAYGARPSGDRIALAGLEAKWALFSRDASVVERMMKEIENEMKVRHANERGVQADYSFHHRPDRVNNTLTYGLQFINVYAEWADYVSDTRFRFSEEAMKIAVDFYLDGICKQMVNGKLEDTGILNRDITRVHQEVMSPVTPERLMKTTDYRKDELQQVVNARTGKEFTSPTFAKFFWQTEHFAIQRPTYYTSVRMFSVRNKNMEEPYNNEGIYNHFRADGTNYLAVSGNEYLNLSPMLDWCSVPGATTPIVDKMPNMWQIQKEGQTDFVGAVTDGVCGAAAFDFVSPHFPLKAKKSWFFFDDEYVCLGAGIRASCKYPIVTTLNQCFLKGDVKVLSANGAQSVAKGKHEFDKASGVWHNGVGYLFPEVEKIGVSNQEETGTWYDISPRSDASKDVQRADVFKARIEHGVRPRNDQYAYVVLPGVTAEQWQARRQQSDIKILSNTTDLQAVEQTTKGIVYLNGYRSFTISLGNQRGAVSVDSPGMVMLNYAASGKLTRLVVSDPTRKMSVLHLSVSGKHELAADAHQAVARYCAKDNKTYISIALPQDDMAGSSVQVNF